MFHSLDQRTKLGVLALGGAFVGAVGFVGWRSVSGGAVPPGVEAQTFSVYVAGAVKQPKVVDATATMIVAEAIDAAGGSASDADLAALNLAARVQPNTSIYVPSVGEDARDRLGSYAIGAPAPVASDFESTSSTHSGGGALVNINTASLAELDTLPGVGPVTAQKIVDYRDRHGGFKTVDELLNVAGIGPKKMEQLRARVTVN